MLLNDVSMTSLSNTQSTVDMAIEQWRGRLLELVCVRKEGTSNTAFELTDCVDFVNHLSLLCNCVMLCLNVRSLSKTTLS